MSSAASVDMREVVGRVLEPYVGRGVAETCVRATAISLGKTSDELGRADLDSVAESVRGLLAPITTKAKVDSLIEQIRSEVAS